MQHVTKTTGQKLKDLGYPQDAQVGQLRMDETGIYYVVEIDETKIQVHYQGRRCSGLVSGVPERAYINDLVLPTAPDLLKWAKGKGIDIKLLAYDSSFFTCFCRGKFKNQPELNENPAEAVAAVLIQLLT